MKIAAQILSGYFYLSMKRENCVEFYKME